MEDVKKLLATLGLNSSSADSIYTAICDAPANYPKYYVGYLEILSLKDAAKTLWEEDYSDYAFHEWILTSGPGDFGSLGQKLKSEN